MVLLAKFLNFGRFAKGFTNTERQRRILAMLEKYDLFSFISPLLLPRDLSYLLSPIQIFSQFYFEGKLD
jgi:hypothetical protein